MAIKEPRRDFRANEEEYFHRLDVELIQKIREREQLAEKLRQREGHRGHCGHCGSELRDWTFESMQGQLCSDCGHVHLAFETLERLVKDKAERSAIYELEKMVRPPMRRSG